HCSYKNSILQLKTLPTESERALTKTGEENAGALDIGDGLAVVFKIESHNHPTAVEPYQGAATGVGGIMRDIFTMGARPICSLNSLRFGPPDQKRNRFLLNGAVKGIGDYGNCLGIPVAGGEIFFDPTFTRNCLVNAMTVGIVKHNEMAFAKAEGTGNPVFIVGASTGRDGIHGASFASRDLTSESESKRSAVQVGDPFMEKLLLEATLELINSGAITGIQDMGAAGISCSTSEMSAKGGVGMRIDLDKVPLRETGMNAYEIMLSESQERMLVVAHKGREDEVRCIFEKWELSAVEIGTVTDDGLLHIYREGRLCALIPAESLVLGGGAPRYERDTRRSEQLDVYQRTRFTVNGEPVRNQNAGANTSADDSPVQDIPAGSAGEDFLELLASANISSRRAVQEQYDTEVGLARVIGPGGDGGVTRVHDTNKGIAVATDCNSRYVSLDPFNGAAQAVCESARNVAVTGARPLGITNCLNFGNPYIPENYYMFTESIRGMGAACSAFQIPVTGGNVSFYNESVDGPVRPTPTIGMVGLLDEIQKAVRAVITRADIRIGLIGNFQPSFGGSEYLYLKTGTVTGAPPRLDLDQEVALVNFLCSAAQKELLHAAHDLSLGGLAVALFRMAYDAQTRSSIGIQLEAAAIESLRANSAPDALWLFGETNGCVLVACEPERLGAVQELAQAHSLTFLELGHSTEEPELQLKLFSVATPRAAEVYENGELFRAFQRD
ncbi:MAG: phosphoribosylformylglycinamidine synthase subunit PurL, partial [Leptospiraceae bacterium]|nr:phosphoribosylformylglycinamidine synthase subunit PurL [Leptospiraceae bacterium]